MVRVARLERAASTSQMWRPTNWATPGYSLSCHDTTARGKNKVFSVCGHSCGQNRFCAVFCNRWKIPQTQVSQGFAAFRPTLTRIPPRHSQSRRATSCATPGYVLFRAAACVCTHFKRERRFLPHPFSAIALSSRVRFQTAQAARLYILQFA